MTVSNEAITRIVNLITADLDDGRAGTGTTIPTPEDTDLETVVADTESDVTTASSGGNFSVTHLMDSTQGNGSDLTEFQIRMNGEATQLNRVVIAPQTKSTAIELTKITVFNLLGE